MGISPHGEIMYGSIDNSWNDCINEKNLIIKNNTSLHCGKRSGCFGKKYTGSCHVPVQFHVYVIELTFDFCLRTSIPVLTTSTNVVAWPQGDQLLGGDL